MTHLLFAYSQYYPRGGFNDFMFGGTLDDCLSHIQTRVPEIIKESEYLHQSDRDKYNSDEMREVRSRYYGNDWCHIVHINTMQVVRVGRIENDCEIEWLEDKNDERWTHWLEAAS